MAYKPKQPAKTTSTEKNYTSVHAPIRDTSPSPPHALHRHGVGGYASRHWGVQIVSRSAGTDAYSLHGSGGSLVWNQESLISTGEAGRRVLIPHHHSSSRRIEAVAACRRTIARWASRSKPSRFARILDVMQ